MYADTADEIGHTGPNQTWVDSVAGYTPEAVDEAAARGSLRTGADRTLVPFMTDQERAQVSSQTQKQHYIKKQSKLLL